MSLYFWVEVGIHDGSLYEEYKKLSVVGLLVLAVALLYQQLDISNSAGYSTTEGGRKGRKVNTKPLRFRQKNVWKVGISFGEDTDRGGGNSQR